MSAGFGQSRAKAERLLQLTAALGGGRPISLAELRDNFGLYAEGDLQSTRRQFERDKSSLRDHGVVIETVDYGEGPHYWIRSRRQSFSLTEEELDALAVLAAVVGDPSTGVSLAAFAGEAGQFPADDSPGKVAVGNLDIPPVVTTALAEGRQLQIRYRNADGEESQRTIEPWELRFRNGLTYVVGHDDKRDEKRNFRLDRIVGDPELGEVAVHQRPDGPVGPVHPIDRFDFEVTLDADHAGDVVEFGGQILRADDAAVAALFPDRRPETILSWAMRRGARVTSPESWAQAQRERLEHLVARHRASPPSVDVPAVRKTHGTNLSVERLRRLMVLPRFLSRLQGVTREELADYLGCTLDELDAELELLDTVELPGHGPVGEVEELRGQIVYHRHLHDPTIQLSPADALRLLFLVEMVRPILGEGNEGLEAIADRLHQIVPATVKIDLAGARHPDLDAIKTAIASGTTIRFEYQGRKDPGRRARTVVPSQFRIANGAIYLAGHDVDAGGDRQFRLDRMGSVEALGHGEASVTESRNPEYRPSSDEVSAVLLLGIRATWLLPQLGPSAVEHLDDGSVVAVVLTDATDWLVGHVLAAGGEAEVISPPELRAAVANRASATLDPTSTDTGAAP